MKACDQLTGRATMHPSGYSQTPIVGILLGRLKTDASLDEEHKTSSHRITVVGAFDPQKHRQNNHNWHIGTSSVTTSFDRNV